MFHDHDNRYRRKSHVLQEKSQRGAQEQAASFHRRERVLIKVSPNSITEAIIPDVVLKIAKGDGDTRAFERSYPRLVQKNTRENFLTCGKLKHVAIEEGVEEIEPGAFNLDRELETVVLPGSIKKIPARAFSSCFALRELTLGEGIKEIGEQAFAHCTALEHVLLPQSLRSIGELCFTNLPVA